MPYVDVIPVCDLLPAPKPLERLYSNSIQVTFTKRSQAIPVLCAIFIKIKPDYYKTLNGHFHVSHNGEILYDKLTIKVPRPVFYGTK
jgi:hypothetical protein